MVINTKFHDTFPLDFYLSCNEKKMSCFCINISSEKVYIFMLVEIGENYSNRSN